MTREVVEIIREVGKLMVDSMDLHLGEFREGRHLEKVGGIRVIASSMQGEGLRFAGIVTGQVTSDDTARG